MIINTKLFYVLQALIVVVIIGLVVGFVLFTTSQNTSTDAVEKKVKVERLQASAKIYYARLMFYDGVCRDIGVAKGISCDESGTAYAVEAYLDNGIYYCADSTGFLGETTQSKGRATACQKGK